MNASEVRCVEAHGTGTALGDPIEMGALSAVLSTCCQARVAAFVGAVKTNSGHALATSGLLGLGKCAAMFGRRGALQQSYARRTLTCVGVNAGFLLSSVHF